MGATTYGFRSGLLTAKASLSAGAKTYTITASDLAGNSVTSGTSTVTVDNTAPTVTAVAIQKSTGGTAGVVRKNGTYYVYANAADTGGAGSGVGDHERQRPHLGPDHGDDERWFMDGGRDDLWFPVLGPDRRWIDRAGHRHLHGDGDRRRGEHDDTVRHERHRRQHRADGHRRHPVQGSGRHRGAIRQAGTYYVYANVTDAGGGALQTITADASALTTGRPRSR